VDLLGDTVKLREERKKCRQNSEKYKQSQGNVLISDINRLDRFEEEETFPTRFDRHPFPITAEVFKDTPPAGSIKSKNLPEPEEIEEFEPFSKPTQLPPPAGFSSIINTNPIKPPEWDPFSNSTSNPIVTPPGDLDTFNPRPTPLISTPEPMISPIISNPITPPTIPTQSPVSKTIPPNLFKTVDNNPGTFTTNTSSPIISTTPLDLSKNNPVSPVKSSDTWSAHSHLFSNLSMGTTTAPKTTNPRNNTINVGGGKTLGDTVGTGWPQTTTPVPLAYPYSVPVQVTPYPVGYSTYPPSIPSNMFSNQNYSNTSTWGI
jgi:hypothetical protein